MPIPGVTVDTLAVPFDQLKNKFTTEASTGGGPDLLIGPKDWIGELTQANLIAPLDDLADKDRPEQPEPVGRGCQQVPGQGVGFPRDRTEAMALWYNKDLVKEAAEEHRRAAQAGDERRAWPTTPASTSRPACCSATAARSSTTTRRACWIRAPRSPMR